MIFIIGNKSIHFNTRLKPDKLLSNLPILCAQNMFICSPVFSIISVVKFAFIYHNPKMRSNLFCSGVFKLPREE